MDKYEYKVRADEIKALIADGEYAEAVKIADTIDWRRVRSVMMLCTVSDLYKINRRYRESKDLLLLAYDKHPTGRLIVYSLCELSIKMEEYVQAVEYYKEFVQIAPKDTGQYVLLYRLYEAQDVSLEERIAVLEDFKKRDYREKWAYELAYLYHRIGLATKCIEECDEMYLWFGEGKYVIKALELKALHAPLNSEQQEKYNAWIAGRDAELAGEAAEGESENQTKNTRDNENLSGIDTEDASAVMAVPTTELPEVKTVDVGQYNTLNLQMALAESMREILTDEETAEEEVQLQEPQEAESEEPLPDTEIPQEPEIAAEEPPSIAEKIIAPLLQETQELPKVEVVQDTGRLQESSHQSLPEIKPTAEIKSEDKSIKYDDVLSQEYDGQIRLVVPEEKAIEKQITGQLSIEDIMAEWEEMKKNNEQKRMEDVRKRILNQTDGLFADFDEATKSGLLEQLEKAFVAAMMQDTDKVSATEKVITPEDAIAELKAAEQSNEQSGAKDTVLEEEPESISEMLPEEIAESEEEAEEIENSGAQDNPDKVLTTESKKRSRQPDARKLRELTDEEKELFGQYIHHKKSREQLVHTLDNMSLAACTGNVIITGEESELTLSLAKALIREMQYNDSNFSGKVAKISAAVLNDKDVAETLKRLSNGALIIEKGADLNTETVTKLGKELETDNMGLLLFLEDTKQRMNGLLEKNAGLNNNFNLRVDLKSLDDEALVACAKQYAERMEYSIDEFGILALHTRISDMQTSDHEVTRAEVIELVEEAIYYANKKTPKHFVDILLAKRYDEEDMIILRENDFMHY